MIGIADPEIGDAEHRAVERVLDSGQLAAGDEVDAFETEFADFAGAQNAVATSNGTTALHAALSALDLPVGTQVVTTPFSFIATANAIRFAGYQPVFADIDPETFALDPDSVEQAIRDHDDVGAIVAVHLYGLPADMPALREIADATDCYLVEDAAQAHGARIDDEPIGTHGDAATYSFYPTKNMTTGEGGMITTDDPELASHIRSFIDHGRSGGGSYEHVRIGHNFRLTDLGAAIGRAQLDRLPEFNAARRKNAIRYDEALADVPIITPTEPSDRHHVYHQYTIRTDRRDELRAHLADHDIGSAVYYPTPIHQQPPYGYVDRNYPVAERLADEVLSLPVHPNLDVSDIDRVVEAIEAFEGVRV